MSQYSADLTLSMLRQGGSPVVSALAVELLSLRAAVRRVLEADLATTCNHKQPPLLRYALNSLRAEMARIDGNDPVVVERGGPAPTEALQKITEKQIQEGIDAALRGACKSVDELRRQMP